MGKGRDQGYELEAFIYEPDQDIPSRSMLPSIRP